MDRPESMEKLIKRRLAVLRKLKKQKTDDKSLEPIEIHKVDDAFEVILTPYFTASLLMIN